MSPLPLLLAVAAPCFTLVFGGDVMLNGVPVGPKALREIRPLLQTGNATFANLEIPLTSKRTKTTAKSADEVKRRTQFILKGDPCHAPYLHQAGIDLVSLGNNHAMDYGADGLTQMLDTLRKAQIRFAGAGRTRHEALKVAVYTTRQGVRVGLVSALAFVGPKAIAKLGPASDDQPGIGALSFGGVLGKPSLAALGNWIGGAKKSCDFLVVGLHWGIERKDVPTPYQVALGRACIDAGADVVWGNHPHVLQGAELYKGKPVLYSMGNLISARPSQTALARIFFEPNKPPKFRLIPCSVANGKVVPVDGSPCSKAVAAFQLLSEKVQKLYPSRDSKPLY